MDKKGQLNLGIIQAVMVFLLVLGVVAIALFISVTELSQESVISRRTISNNEVVNTTALLIETGNTTTDVLGLTDVSFAQTVITNATGGQLITSPNYTMSSAGVLTAASGITAYNNSEVNISGTFSYTVESDAVKVADNITYGTTNFFSNIPTAFAILGAVIIILAIVLIIVAASRFSGASSSLNQ